MKCIWLALFVGVSSACVSQQPEEVTKVEWIQPGEGSETRRQYKELHHHLAIVEVNLYEGRLTRSNCRELATVAARYNEHLRYGRIRNTYSWLALVCVDRGVAMPTLPSLLP